MKQLDIQKYILGLSDESFKDFLSKIETNILLTDDELVELVHHIQIGDEEAEQAMDELVQSNLRIIVAVAKKYKHLNHSFQELVAIGISGLVKASEKYDEVLGFTFSSYAVRLIRQSMLNAIAKRDAQDKETDTIVLSSLRELLCFPKSEDVDPYVDNGLTALAEGNKDLDVFLQNAHLFYRHADHILTDSKMFFAPVLVQNGMTYKGTPGSHYPTLGMYIEWWRKCKVDVTKDAEGQDALTYSIAGNPLTGSNKCKCVYPDGHSASITHKSFLPMLSTFQKISKRYHEAKVLFDTYTLDEVAQILSKCE